MVQMPYYVACDNITILGRIMDKEVFYDGRDWTKEQAIQAIKDHTLRYLRLKKGDWDFYESHRYAYDLLGLLKDNHLIARDEAAPFYERLIRSESVEEQPVQELEQVERPVSMDTEQVLDRIGLYKKEVIEGLRQEQVDELAFIAKALSDSVSNLDLFYAMTDSGSMASKEICDIRNAVNNQIIAIERFYL